MIDLCAIRRIQTALRRFEQSLREQSGLTLNEAFCLCTLKRGVHEPGHIARELELSPSRLSRVLDVLEQRGLITRTISPEDRRNIAVSLTETGTELVEKYQCSSIELPEALQFTQLSTQPGTELPAMGTELGDS
ncbi:MAG TPA: MarR family transcriptional regulator [Treponemataceae bacterium]|nr:MarR family transcriptional regulator [Treponemataceae bacterium]HOS34480.1 MarR family transcriptional regulator [Treponemataceae bacterium]HPL90404.1 MarR family transcriptional regulator [Treponemataceae bacterium]HQB87565.1 MarR family transcriptional regulator [Treponemataceae bacterium]